MNVQVLIEALKTHGVKVEIPKSEPEYTEAFIDFKEHDKKYLDRIEELTEENDELKSERMLPDTPIEAAQMLINATAEYKSMFFEQTTSNIYGISELKQIAEHLLVYCNNNKEVER